MMPTNFKASKSLNLPPFDLEAMLEEDKRSSDMTGPFRFGKGFDVNIELDKTEFKEVAGGRVWAMDFESRGAKSINFVFKEFYLSKGAQLFVYNETGTVVYGPVTHLNNPKNGFFLTDLILGDKVTLYLYEPNNSDEKSSLKISRIVHGYRSAGEMAYGDPGASESCNNDINCFPAWDLESDGVGLVLLANGTEWCSGSLLMSVDQSFRAYFLSAFHCIDVDPRNGVISAAERSDAEDWLFKFQFKSTSCNGSAVNLGATYSGATFRAAWATSDFSLMELTNSPIGNSQISWLGWDRRANIPTSGTAIHHPAGDLMKISFENNNFQTSSWGGTNNNWLVFFDDGVVQHISSGSPIMNQNKRLVGQLRGNQTYIGGVSYCNQPRAEYGRFNLSWNGGGTDETSLRNWLDPCYTEPSTTNTTRSPYISGNSIICTSASYSLSGLPSGSTIVWSNSSNITRNSSQGSNPCTFSKYVSGNGWIQATVTPPNSCGNTFVIRKYVTVGGVISMTWFGTGPYGQVDVTVYGGTAPFKFYRNGSLIYTSYSSSATIPFGCNGGVLKAEANTSCGVASVSDIVPQGCSPYYMVVYPNPASSEVYVKVVDKTDADARIDSNDSSEFLPTESELTLELYDFSGNMVRSDKFEARTTEIKINVSGLPKGNYFLRILGKELNETHQIVVE